MRRLQTFHRLDTTHVRCPLFQARQQIWPTCVSLKTKLWGSAEDVFLTCGTHGREDLVNATIISNAEEELPPIHHETARLSAKSRPTYLMTTYHRPRDALVFV